MSSETLSIQSYLTFRLGDEYFAASVAQVSEILELSRITKVPRSPHFMRGVINLRGNVLPVIDTRIKFGFDKIEDNVNTCIMVLNVEIENETISIGALVDAVQEVIEIDPFTIQQPPSIGAKYKTEFIEGMIQMNEHFIMLLNLNLVFNTEEMSILQHVAEEKN